MQRSYRHFARLSLSPASLAALFVVGLFALHASRAGLPGRLWSHVAYGRWIIDNREISEAAPLSIYSHPANTYIDPCWLSRVVLAGACRLGQSLADGDEARRVEGGVEMLRLLHALLILLFALLLFVAYRRQSGSTWWACAGLVLLGAVWPPLPGPLRPEVFGMVCFAAVLLAVGGPRPSWWTLLWVPLLFALWANLHPSFLPGLLLLFVFFLGRIIDVCLKASSWNVLRAWEDARVWLLLFLLLLSALATLLTPWGRNLYIPGEDSPNGLVELVKQYVLADMPGWRPLEFSRWEPHTCFLLGSLVLLTLTQAASPRPFTGTQMVVLFAFAVLPLFLARLVVWWFPLVPWLLLPHWAAVAERWRGAEPRPAADPRGWMTVAALVLIAAFLWLLLPVGWLLTGRPRPLSATLPADTPWRVALQLRELPNSQRRWLPALADRLSQSYPDGRFKGVIFATTTTGDFLVWALRGDWPVFMFSEIQYFGMSTWQDYLAVRKPESDWWEILDRREVNLIVLDRRADAELAAALAKDAAWEIVEGEASPGTGLLVAVRKVP